MQQADEWKRREGGEGADEINPESIEFIEDHPFLLSYDSAPRPTPFPSTPSTAWRKMEQSYECSPYPV